jgi:heme A synthase
VQKIFLVFHVTAAIVFIQLIMGGLFVFGYVPYRAHLITGIVVGIMSILALMTALFLVKPRCNNLVYPSVFMFALVLLQGALGFSISHVPPLVIVHYTNALIIFALSIVMVTVAVRESRRRTVPSTAESPPSPVAT